MTKSNVNVKLIEYQVKSAPFRNSLNKFLFHEKHCKEMNCGDNYMVGSIYKQYFYLYSNLFYLQTKFECKIFHPRKRRKRFYFWLSILKWFQLVKHNRENLSDIYLAWSASWSFGERHPRLVFSRHGFLHRLRRPFLVSTHVDASWEMLYIIIKYWKFKKI